jgi:hypothetical protein
VLRLRRIIDLLAAGVNLAGIAMVLDLQDDNTRMRRKIHQQAEVGHQGLAGPDAGVSSGGADPLGKAGRGASTSPCSSGQ